MIADPKVILLSCMVVEVHLNLLFMQALQHIYHKSGYNYQKPIEVITGTKLIASASILSADGTFALGNNMTVQ